MHPMSEFNIRPWKKPVSNTLETIVERNVMLRGYLVICLEELSFNISIVTKVKTSQMFLVHWYEHMNKRYVID